MELIAPTIIINCSHELSCAQDLQLPSPADNCSPFLCTLLMLTQTFSGKKEGDKKDAGKADGAKDKKAGGDKKADGDKKKGDDKKKK